MALFRRHHMEKIDKSKIREIIVDFAKDIEQRKRFGGQNPQKAVIYFRSERKQGTEREVYDVPIELLRYRKDNGSNPRRCAKL